MIAGLKPYAAYKDSGVPWLGEVPAHWEIRPLKWCLRCHSGNGIPTDEVSSERTDERSIPVIGGNGIMGFCDSTNYNHAVLAVGRVGALCGNVHVIKPPAWITDNALVLSVNLTTVSLEYLAGILKVRNLNDLADKTAQPLITGTHVRNERAPFPPLPEQTVIVRFLDHADRRIQRYIRAKQKLIALLEEQKQAIIHQAVTGQIDVRTGQPYPAYKPSGVEWLGDVPTHWSVWRGKRTFTPRKELARPDDIQLSATQAYGVIAQADYEKRIGRKIVKILRHLEKRRHVEVDDFVISMRSFQGGLERAWVSGCIRSSYIVLQPATNLAVGYFAYLFKSIGYIKALQATANFIRDGQDLNFENFCEVDVPFPPIEDQRQIAQTLDDITVDIASTIERYRRQIELLREYRTRLIADVVTGKLDVREAAAALPEVDPLAADDALDDALDTDAA